MSEKDKIRLELLELKMDHIMWQQSDNGFYNRDEVKRRNDRIRELEELLKLLRGEY
jgi:hypothetical protein